MDAKTVKNNNKFSWSLGDLEVVDGPDNDTTKKMKEAHKAARSNKDAQNR